MRRLAIILVLLSCTTLYGQKAKKPSLGKVEIIVNKGKAEEVTIEELAQCVDNIERATTYEKTMEKPKTWYLRGMVYKLIFEKGEEIAGITAGDAIKKAAESFEKTTKMAKESDLLSVNADLAKSNLWAVLLNRGVESYNSDSLKEALDYFEYTTLVKPGDTTGYLYAGSIASELKQYDRAIKNYKNLVKIQPKDAHYGTIISIQKDILKDYDAAKNSIAEAKEVLGDDNVLINKYEIDYLLVTEQVDSAIDKLENAIAAEPENARLYLRRGLLFDNLAVSERKSEQPDQAKIEEYIIKAENAYKKVIELEPDNLTAYFNQAIIYNERANKIYNELGAMGIKEYQKKKESFEVEAKKHLQRALPLMEKAYEISPDDADILYALESFYSRLKLSEKLKEVKTKMESLGLVDE